MKSIEKASPEVVHGRRRLHRSGLPHQDPPGVPRRAGVRAGLPRRGQDIAAEADLARSSSAALAIVLSAGWWVAVVELLPACCAPYIGGSQNNSFLELTFGYNGLGRINGDETGCVGGGGGGGGNWGATGLGRMFNAEIGGQISWLIPAALILLVAGLYLRGRRPRTDTRRAAYLVWGGGSSSRVSPSRSWPASSTSTTPSPWRRPSPPSSAWALRRRGSAGTARWARITLAVATAATAVWGFVLLVAHRRLARLAAHRRPGGRPRGGAGAPRPRADPPARRRRGRRRGTARGARRSGGLLGPDRRHRALRVDRRRGSHGGRRHRRSRRRWRCPRWAGTRRRRPRGRLRGARDRRVRLPAAPLRARCRVARPRVVAAAAWAACSTPRPRARRWSAALSADADQYTWVAAAIGSQNAAGLQLGTQLPVMAIGGFNGSDPSPTLAQFQAVRPGREDPLLPRRRRVRRWPERRQQRLVADLLVGPAELHRGDHRRLHVLRPDPARLGNHRRHEQHGDGVTWPRSW